MVFLVADGVGRRRFHNLSCANARPELVGQGLRLPYFILLAFLQAADPTPTLTHRRVSNSG